MPEPTGPPRPREVSYVRVLAPRFRRVLESLILAFISDVFTKLISCQAAVGDLPFSCRQPLPVCGCSRQNSTTFVLRRPFRIGSPSSTAKYQIRRGGGWGFIHPIRRRDSIVGRMPESMGSLCSGWGRPEACNSGEDPCRRISFSICISQGRWYSSCVN